MQAVPDDVADHQGHTGARQRDDVEPVPAHPRLGGQVAVGDLDRGLVRYAAGQQAALQRHGHGVLAGEAAGVVDGQRRPGGQLLGEGHVLLLERRGRPHPPEAGHPQQHPAGPQRDGDHGVDALVQHALGTGGVLGHPVAGVPQVRHPHRVLSGHPDRHGAGRDEPDQLADRIERMRVLRGDHGGAAHLGARLRRLVAVQHRVQQVDRGDVGEPRDRHLRQLPGGALHVQGRTDAHPRVIEQLQPLVGHFGPAGEGPQLGGVPQGDHGPRLSEGRGGPDVDRQQPIGRHVQLVGGGPARGDRRGDALLQAQLRDGAAFRVP